ncbi:hypothetical protein A9498_31110 (plasmid) [Bacillus thuringiensis serovar coreanensis]|nr:hypothetical protein A9498_31110 [Bacillus thuringiensis serovar coreanensis]
MNTNITDVMALFSEYAHKWSQQRGGGSGRIALSLPGYESYAFSVSDDETMYYAPKEEEETTVDIASHTFTNTDKRSMDMCIELDGEVENSAQFMAPAGASEGGKRLLNITMPTDIPSFLVNQPAISLPLGEDKVTISEKQPFVVNHPFTIRPRFKVTATLKAKQKQSTRCFDIKSVLSGYVGVLTSEPVNGQTMSLHHVARILERFYSPYIKADRDQVALFVNGVLTTLSAYEPYIHIVEESLDIPDLVEEYDIYNPQIGGDMGAIIPSYPSAQVMQTGSAMPMGPGVVTASNSIPTPSYSAAPNTVVTSSPVTSVSSRAEDCFKHKHKECGCSSCRPTAPMYDTSNMTTPTYTTSVSSQAAECFEHKGHKQCGCSSCSSSAPMYDTSNYTAPTNISTPNMYNNY